MSKQNIVVSKYSLYLMAHPDATRNEFMTDTGGKVKDWYNTRDRVSGNTLRDRGVRLPHSKSIVYLMINPEATKEQYVKAGFNPETYLNNCNRARELLLACSAAGTYITKITNSIEKAKREAKKAAVKPKIVLKPVEPKPEPQVKPRLLQIKEPEQCLDHSDLVIKINSAVTDLVTELNAKQAEIGTYRARIIALNAENFRLRAEVSELTEMINGPSK